MNLTGKYRRDGTPYSEGDIGLREWAADFNNPDYRRIRQETLPNGYYVSTVWLGLAPLIFETMVKCPDGSWDNYQERYSTEDDAIIGHLKAVDLYIAKV